MKVSLTGWTGWTLQDMASFLSTLFSSRKYTIQFQKWWSPRNIRFFIIFKPLKLIGILSNCLDVNQVSTHRNQVFMMLESRNQIHTLLQLLQWYKTLSLYFTLLSRVYFQPLPHLTQTLIHVVDPPYASNYQNTLSKPNAICLSLDTTSCH